MSCFYEDALCDETPSTNLTTFEHTPVTFLKFSMLSFSLLFGLPLYSYIIRLIITGTGRGIASELFNLNLAVSEIIFSLYSLIYVQKIMFPSVQTKASLIILKFLNGDIVTIRPLFQCVICLERYLAVVHPVTFLKYKPVRYRLICCTVVWIMGLGSSVVYSVVSYNVFIWISLLHFLVFVSIQLFCLLSVLRALKQPGPGDRRREKEENQMKRRAFYIIVVMTITTLVIFGPFIMSRLFYIVAQGDIPAFNLLSLYCFVLGGFVPAFLYLRRTGKLPFIRTL